MPSTVAFNSQHIHVSLCKWGSDIVHLTLLSYNHRPSIFFSFALSFAKENQMAKCASGRDLQHARLYVRNIYKICDCMCWSLVCVRVPENQSDTIGMNWKGRKRRSSPGTPNNIYANGIGLSRRRAGWPRWPIWPVQGVRPLSLAQMDTKSAIYNMHDIWLNTVARHLHWLRLCECEFLRITLYIVTNENHCLRLGCTKLDCCWQRLPYFCYGSLMLLPPLSWRQSRANKLQRRDQAHHCACVCVCAGETPNRAR